MNKYERAVLLDQNRARRSELVAEMEQRAEHRLLHGDVEWPRAQEEPMVETSSRQQPPAAYREMSDAERRPWDSWLHTALADLRDEVQSAVSIGFAERDALIDKLQNEVAVLTSRVNKSWWSR